MAELMKIEKNIPIPASTAGRPAALRSAIESMDIGDSFLMKAGSVAALYSYAKPTGRKFTTRKTDDPKLIRVWRRA